MTKLSTSFSFSNLVEGTLLNSPYGSLDLLGVYYISFHSSQIVLIWRISPCLSVNLTKGLLIFPFFQWTNFLFHWFSLLFSPVFILLSLSISSHLLFLVWFFFSSCYKAKTWFQFTGMINLHFLNVEAYYYLWTWLLTWALLCKRRTHNLYYLNVQDFFVCSWESFLLIELPCPDSL